MSDTTPVTLPDIPTSYERLGVMLIFGLLTLFMAYNGNNEAAAGYASTLAMYFLARQGA